MGQRFNCFTPRRWVVNGMAMAIAALLGEWLCVRRELQEIPLGECVFPVEELVHMMGSALVLHAQAHPLQDTGLQQKSVCARCGRACPANTAYLCFVPLPMQGVAPKQLSLCRHC